MPESPSTTEQPSIEPTDPLDTLLHQLRNPLTAMTTLAKLWQKRTEPDDPNAWIADRIEQECQHVRVLLEQFERQTLGSDLQASFPVEVNLYEFIQQLWPTYAALASQRHINLKQHLPANIPTLQLDPAKLREVLDNLLDNALKYTPTGGAIAVTLAAEAEAVEIAISDSGPGIAAMDLPLIFEPHYRGDMGERGPAGSGLGLAIARELTTQMGGSIEVSSQPGRGTTFTVRLPVPESLHHESRPIS
ncbi:MAG: HAMP domain-containing sensor histidine kinase [Cyanobacteria bacterium P01_F01_bin.33]